MKVMRKHRLLLITALLAVIFTSVSLIVSFSPEKQASALTNTASAVKAGNGEELWDADSGDFDGEVMDDLLDKLFGDADPVEYIKTMKDTPTDSYVIPASTINAKVGNAANGLVVKLGGMEWMAASLTLAEIEEEENVVLTLYLANANGASQYYSNSNNNKGNNMYSRSIVRNQLLTNATWSLFNTTGEDSFAEQFLVQPKYVKYQQNETQSGRSNPVGGNYHNPNDALGAQSSGWYSGINYQPADTYDGKRYDDWGNDYIWLPSITETGTTNYVNNNSSIWKLSTNQLAHTVSQGYSWLRSGYYGNYNGAYFLPSSGAYSAGSVGNTTGVRPALHFNLSSAALGAAGATLKNPENVTTTYNGDVQTLKSAYDANSKSASWYNKKWYEHTNNYVTVTPSAEMKNAGEYWVKVELQQKWFDDVEAQVEADGAAQGWTAEEIAEAKIRKKPKFKGEPDTSDSEHVESDRVRWFKFTIKPKEITVTKPAYNASTGVFVAPSFADDGELYGDPPVVATKFTGTAADGTAYDKIDVMPTKRGTYTAQTIFVKSATDKTEYTGNYVVKDAANMTCTVQINRSRVAIPAVADASKQYTGEKITFALSGYSTEWTEIATLNLPSGMTLEGSDADGWRLAVTDAGTYTVTAAIKQDKKTDWCWNTANFTDEVITDRSFSVTVTRKTLTVSFTSSNGAFLLQAGESVSFGASASGVHSRDSVKLTLEYFNSTKPTVRIPVSGDSLDASTLNPGTYYLVATLADSAATGNQNYKIDGGETLQEFTVSAKNITVNSVNWQYSQNNGVPTPIAGGAGSASSSPVEVTYNGSAFVFALNTNGLAEAGVKVDASYGTNGYTNSSQTNAGNAVAVTVRLIPFDEGWAFNDAGGKPLAQQYKDFTVYVKVNKANVDFSAVVWSAEELEYNGVNQSVSIVSGLPSFLTVTYNANATKKEIGTYVAKVSSLTVNDTAAAANYNVPTDAQMNAEPKLSHTWKIVKKRIEIVWVNASQSQGGTTILVPTVSDNSSGAIEYVYYNEDKTREMTLEEIFADYDATQMKDYYVCARLKTSGGTYNQTNCVLIESGAEVTESYKGFQAGAAKNPVRVGLKVSTVIYNKSEQPAQIEFEGGNLTASDFTVAYKKDGVACGTPKYAGEYKVIISLNKNLEGDYAITGSYEFDYVIEKASYDVSAMKWVDTEHGNAEYTAPYVYTHGVSHTLSFTGDNIAGLNVNYTADTESNLTGENAGDYKVVVTFSVADPANYNVPETIEFIWTITPYTPDLSGVTWNYNTDGPYFFRIENGVPVKYSARLTGIPEGLEELIVYSDDTGEYSDAGSHITSFAINESHANRKNYGELVFGAGLDDRLVWEIKPIEIDKGVKTQKQTYREEGYTFAEITNLPDDWAQYFEIEVLDSENNPLAQADGTWKFVNVDQYRIKIVYKTGMNKNNGGTADNVKWSDNTKGSWQITLTINKLVLDVKGWIDGSENARAELDADDVAAIEKYFDYEIINTENNQKLPVTATLAYETVYTIALKLKSQFKDNVAVNYFGHEVEETAPYAFQTETDPLADPPTNFYRKPTEKELYFEYKYTGDAITFALGDWYVSDKMQIMSGVLQGTDEGTYLVRVGFKKGAFSAWQSDDDTDFDRAPVTVTFVISQDAKIADKFVLTAAAAASHPFKFQYGDFTEETKIDEYTYSAEKPLFITRLALGDTLAALLAQFENGADIKVYDASGKEITDFSTVLATGMVLRLMDGSAVLNQLTISVLGDVNGDGDVTTVDKAQLNAHTTGTRLLSGAYLLAGEVYDDGDITTVDKAQLNAQTLGTRDIYAALRLSAVVRSKAASKQSVFSAEKEVFISVAERTADSGTAVCYAEEKDKTERIAEERQAISVESRNSSLDVLLNEKRYVICNDREVAL